MINFEGKNVLKPIVSVLVVTFNQAGYLRQCLDSIFIQKTNFNFEVIVQNDCSADETESILQEYAMKYSPKIVVVNNKNNIYSQGIEIFSAAAKYAKGEYFALCEGDDYWLSNQKLQEQFDLLSRNADFNMVAHNHLILDGTKLTENACLTRAIIPAKVVAILGGGIFSTASLFIKRQVLLEASAWLNHAPITDYFLQVYAALPNGVLYLNKPYSVYRRNAVGSWSSSAQNIENVIAFESKVETLFSCDKFIADVGSLYPVIKNYIYSYLCASYLRNGCVERFRLTSEKLVFFNGFYFKVIIFKVIKNFRLEFAFKNFWKLKGFLVK